MHVTCQLSNFMSFRNIHTLENVYMLFVILRYCIIKYTDSGVIAAAIDIHTIP